MNGPRLALIILFSVFALAGDARAELPLERRNELLHLLKHDCGSCHGITLRGGLGPALTPQSLADKPDEALEAMICHGMPERAMPPWGEILTREEIRWLLARIREGVAP